MWAKVKSRLLWLGAGILATLGGVMYWRETRRKPYVIKGGQHGPYAPKPIPTTQAEVDAELEKLGRLKRVK